MKLFRPKLRSLPRLSNLISQGLGTDGLVWLKLPPPNANAGQALACCKNKIQSVLDRGPHVYKIGITADPMFRFYKEWSSSSPTFGYYRCHEKFKGMYVLFACSTWDEAALMEATLIDSHKGLPGNRNIRPGGEGRVSGEPPFFTYLVFKSAM